LISQPYTSALATACLISAMFVSSVVAQPIITNQPSDVSVSLGANVTFQVSVKSAAPPLSYLWQFNDLKLLSATNRSLTVTNVQIPSAGPYTVVVADSSGSLTSRVARLEVDPTFTKITTGAIVNDSGASVGCAWGDYDNDGFVDLFVTNLAGRKNFLYHNDRNATFTRINSGAIANDAQDWRGCTWADYDNDGFVDLFVARFGVNWLFHNEGNNAFLNITNNLLGAATDNSHCAIWSDYNNDGLPDLFVPVNSSIGPQMNRLYLNLGGGFFAAAPSNSIPTHLGSSNACAWADYDNDGYPDLLVISDKIYLFHNNGDGTFTEMTSDVVGSLVNAAAKLGGCSWGDYDNDGYLDLYITNQGGPNGGNSGIANSLYHNNGDGSFTRILTGSLVNEVADPFSCAWGDYDNDGFLDLFVANSAEKNALFRNNGNSNAWLKVKLVGTFSNRSAMGAKVRVKATIGGKTFWQLREINTGNGFNQSPLEAHFGLGNATNVDLLRIEWPSGIVQTLTNVAPKQFLTVVEHQDNATGAIRFTAAEPSTTGAIQLSASGAPGLRYVFEASTNLLSWTKLGARTNVNGTVEFLNSKATNFNQRFYRLSAP
jgi:ASPIC and UnbV/FG-GAP-like repeat/Immunoglobulin domain